MANFEYFHLKLNVHKNFFDSSSFKLSKTTLAEHLFVFVGIYFIRNANISYQFNPVVIFLK